MTKQRKSWIIDRKLQLRLVFLLLAVGILNLLFYVFLLLYFFNEFRTLYELPGFIELLPAGYFNQQNETFAKAAVFGFLFQGVLLVMLGIYFSNRISGPVYRLNTVLKEIRQGKEMPFIQLRKHDFMKDLADNFNGVIQHYAAYRQGVVEDLEKFSQNEDLSEENRSKLADLISRVKGSQ